MVIWKANDFIKNIQGKPRNGYNLFAELVEAMRRESRGIARADGKSIHRRSFQLITHPVFISGSAHRHPVCAWPWTHILRNIAEHYRCQWPILRTAVRPVGFCESPMATWRGPFQGPCTCEIAVAGKSLAL